MLIDFCIEKTNINFEGTFLCWLKYKEKTLFKRYETFVICKPYWSYRIKWHYGSNDGPFLSLTRRRPQKPLTEKEKII